MYSLISEQYTKFNSLIEEKNGAAGDKEGASKRRKLDRSQSLGSSETLNTKKLELAISRRSLRSSKSSLGLGDLPSPNDEEPQPSTVRCSRYGSSGTGPTFFPQVPKNILSNVKGKDLFDAIIWSDKKSTETHYTFITSLKHKIDEVQDTSEVHKFIRVLRDGGKLVRNYTQNIDMLEAREGLCTDMSRGAGSRGRFNPKMRKESRAGNDHEGGILDSGVEVVQLHGNLEYLRCGLCLGLSEWEEDDRHLTMLSGEAPPCPKCIEKTEKREGNGRRGLSVGTLRPDIVLYGEANPQEQAIGDLSTHDILLGPDMLIILGTSLKVHGLKMLLREFAKAVHTRGGTVVFVNNTKPPDSVWGDVIDYWVQWDCDEWVRDVKARREEIWTPQGLSRESSPKPQSSQNSQMSGPKNPQSMRTDYSCGAFQMNRILAIVRTKSGRGEDLEEKERIEKINTSRLQSGKALQIKLAPVASKAVVKQSAAAQKSAATKSAVGNTSSLLPEGDTLVVAPHSSKVGTWKTPGTKQPALLPTPVQTSANLNANVKRPRETRPAAVREDKNNMAHYMWTILQTVGRKSGRERTLPDTSAGRKTLFMENRRSGSGATETPESTPASAFALSTHSNMLSPLVPTPSTPLLAKRKRVRPSRARPKVNAASSLPDESDMGECLVVAPYIPRKKNATTLSASSPDSASSQSFQSGDHFVRPYDIQRYATFQASTPSLLPQLPTTIRTPQISTIAATAAASAARKEGSFGSWDKEAYCREFGQFKNRQPRNAGSHRDVRDATYAGQARFLDVGSQLKNEVRLPTPPTSDDSSPSDGNGPTLPSLNRKQPMTPKTRRIKKLGSISSILSSPPPQPPTLSRESRRLMGGLQYPPPHAQHQMALWDGYPDLGQRPERGWGKRSP